jgi:hypothetical protein
MTIYTGATLRDALAEHGFSFHYDTVRLDLLPLLVSVGMAEKPGHDYAVTEEGLAALLHYLRGREYNDLTNVEHSPFLWRAIRNLYDPDQIARIHARYGGQDGAGILQP